MSNTYTPNAKLAMPAVGDTGWAVPVNGNCATLDALAPVGGLAVTTKEVPSASLNVAVAPGTYVQRDGTIGTFAGSSSQAVTGSANTVLYLDLTNSGTLTAAASYPATAHVRLATVTASVSTIASISDNRQCFDVVGSWADGMNLTFGTTTGTKIGTATGQKIGFYGASPVSQQTGGAATAAATYGTNEQGMLNRAYSALRAMGLLS